MSDGVINTVFVDRRYHDHDYVGDVEVHLVDKKRIWRSLVKWLYHRIANKSVVGNLKRDNGLDWNYMIGEEGDRINVTLAGCGFICSKVLWAALFPPDYIQNKNEQLWNIVKTLTLDA
jgi:hypothetical protein